MQTGGPGTWIENCKKSNIKNAHCRTWNMVRHLINLKNEAHSLEDLEYGKEREKCGK
jgi:retron-type reverse transcriptase